MKKILLLLLCSIMLLAYGQSTKTTKSCSVCDSLIATYHREEALHKSCGDSLTKYALVDPIEYRLYLIIRRQYQHSLAVMRRLYMDCKLEKQSWEK